MTRLHETAPAKVNLYLHVVGRRDDGYHLLDSLVVFAGIGDVLSVAPAPDVSRPDVSRPDLSRPDLSLPELSLTVTGPFAAGLSGEPDNLVLRAARALAEDMGVAATGRLVLHKNLPVASGIGGGSADAAAALRLLCRYWAVDPGAERLSLIGGRLGADVPVCLTGRTARMGGIGEVLTPAGPLPPIGMVLVNPGVAVATPAVFRARTGGFSAGVALPAAGWRDAASLLDTLRTSANDLEPPARLLAPVIDDVLGALAALPGCRLARMSGSGATCFGLFDSAAAAADAAAALAPVRPGWWVWGGALNG